MSCPETQMSRMHFVLLVDSILHPFPNHMFRTTMTAYLLATIDVHDAAHYEDYKSAAPALIEKHGGR